MLLQCAFAFLLLTLAVRPLLDRADESKAQFAGVAINVAGAVAILIILVTAVVLVVAKPRTWPSGTLPYVGVLLVSGAAALVAHSDLGPAVGEKPLQEGVRLVAIGAVYVLATTLIAHGASLRMLFVVAGLSAVVPAVVGIVQWIRGVPVDAGLTISRIKGTFTGPNAYGSYLAAAALILIFMPPEWLPRWARFGSAAITLIALVGTFSRTGWTLFFGGILVLGWRGHKRILIGGVAVTVLLVALVPSVRGRVFTNDTPPGFPTSGSRFIPSSYEWRVNNWHALLWTYRQRPLTGYGLRSTEYVNPLVQLTPGEPSIGYSAHNTVVKLLVEGGPLLLLTWSAFFAIAIAKAWRMARQHWSGRTLAWIVFALWVILAFTGLTGDDPLAATALMILVVAIAGAVEGAWARVGTPSEAAPAGGSKLRSSE